MLLALAIYWIFTDILHFEAEFHHDNNAHSDLENSDPQSAPAMHNGPPLTGVVTSLRKVDLTGLLFFTGVLLAVGALDSAGVLRRYATLMKEITGGSRLELCLLLGLSSAVVDNVPLVEAGIDMFKEVEMDDKMWQLMALAAGTGGSCLSIGSIAGVTLMSMEGVGFIWYIRHVSLWALVGFLLGVATYQLEDLAFRR
eukprot:TRINITY_DN109346_c0_g1_i1.p1 TRINITY_DN109346_c0_g1~~TRINITY_DN109346_c0_g1_i1.p1  ORF type:complete len:198 (-),score=29.66 TRINITY_DN109346_c0_g1_i1:53-646(-)